jgi:cystathionine beta-lyase/cystathionine gamma-synthase
MRGGGGASFEVDALKTRGESESLARSPRPSLGGVDSLVTIPVYTSHGMISAEHLQKMGVSDQLIRLSIGIENADDLIADLEQALAVVSSARQRVEVG